MEGLHYEDFSKIEDRYQGEYEVEIFNDVENSIHTSRRSELSPIVLLLDWEKLFYNKLEKVSSFKVAFK